MKLNDKQIDFIIKITGTARDLGMLKNLACKIYGLQHELSYTNPSKVHENPIFTRSKNTDEYDCINVDRMIDYFNDFKLDIEDLISICEYFKENGEI